MEKPRPQLQDFKGGQAVAVVQGSEARLGSEDGVLITANTDVYSVQILFLGLKATSSVITAKDTSTVVMQVGKLRHQARKRPATVAESLGCGFIDSAAVMSQTCPWCPQRSLQELQVARGWAVLSSAPPPWGSGAGALAGPRGGEGFPVVFRAAIPTSPFARYGVQHQAQPAPLAV